MPRHARAQNDTPSSVAIAVCVVPRALGPFEVTEVQQAEADAIKGQLSELLRERMEGFGVRAVLAEPDLLAHQMATSLVSLDWRRRGGVAELRTYSQQVAANAHVTSVLLVKLSVWRGIESMKVGSRSVAVVSGVLKGEGTVHWFNADGAALAYVMLAPQPSHNIALYEEVRGSPYEIRVPGSTSRQWVIRLADDLLDDLRLGERDHR